MELLFIQQAQDAFNSSDRNNYDLFGQKVTNLDAAVFYLLQAHSLIDATVQTDIAISLANIETFKGNFPTALAMYTEALHGANLRQQIDIFCYLSVLYQAVGNVALSQIKLSQLRKVSPRTAQQVTTLLDIIKQHLAKPVCYLPQVSPAKKQAPAPNDNHAIVTLGYRLNSDGSMAQPLLQRLELTRILAQRFPESLIIVTGGLAIAGNTEAELMKQWLINHGVMHERIIEEKQAVNTIENVTYTLAIIQQKAIKRITLVSACIHVHRSQILFSSIQQAHDHPLLVIDHVAVQDELATQAIPYGQTRMNCYIDALRGLGLPAFRCGSTIQV